MPPSPQYRPAGPPGAAGGATTAVARPGRPGPVQAPPPVMVTSELARPAVVWITTELFTKPLMCENPVAGPARPREVTEKKQAGWGGTRRAGETPAPPAQSAQWGRVEMAAPPAAPGAGAHAEARVPPRA